jgi:S-adenosylmethionine decarboxylase
MDKKHSAGDLEVNVGAPRMKITQLLVDLYGCEGDLEDENFLLETLTEAVEKVGANIIRRITQQFSPHGISVILILSETHVSVHTWPEHGYAAVDIFICGTDRNPELAWDVIRKNLKPSSFELKKFVRDIGRENTK